MFPERLARNRRPGSVVAVICSYVVTTGVAACHHSSNGGDLPPMVAPPTISDW